MFAQGASHSQVLHMPHNSARRGRKSTGKSGGKEKVESRREEDSLGEVCQLNRSNKVAAVEAVQHEQFA